MGNISIFFSFSLVLLFLLSLVDETKQAQPRNNNGVYIVYMGAASSTNGSLLRDDHAKLLNSLFRRNANALLRTYKHGFSGFAARLSGEEVRSVAQKPGVVSVFPDPVLKLHTTHSWDFLKYQTSVKIDSLPKRTDSNSSSSGGYDSIIGILDTGIWPESASFNDDGIGEIPSRWNGTCIKGHNFNSSNCNRKVIGARFYGGDDSDSDEGQTARDSIGHGTHVASTAAGSTVTGASYYGLATGTAKGGSPSSRIAVYRVCSTEGCLGSSILAAFDDAISDNVDVLSLSLGAPAGFRSDLDTDPIAIGAFHAVEKGITVVCSAGNDGPTPATVSNAVPWILTVGATTIDRDFESDVVLGGGKVVKGGGINFSTLKNSPVYPLIDGKSAKKSDADDKAASNCEMNSIDENAVKGKIVVCENGDDYTPLDQVDLVTSLGGLGIAIVDDETRAVANNYKLFPATVITSKDAADIYSYINSTRNPVATILPTATVTDYKPAPTIAYFSSRGPSYVSANILKPDIAAPGVNILAAWIGNDQEDTPEGKEPSLFNVISGTSMSCPHVSGVAATVKSEHSEWSPSAIKSAIMTTASPTNNLKAAITTESGSAATPYDYGAGEVTTEGPLQPGLVYETSSIDYLNFLCYIGFNSSKIKVISRTAPSNFACPANPSSEEISNINYPSIAISNFTGTGSRNVSRTVTYVGGDGETVFTASVEAPSGLNIKVTPDQLRFTKNNQKLSYQVIFTPSTSNKPSFGTILWTNGKYKVRSPFVITNEN